MEHSLQCSGAECVDCSEGSPEIATNLVPEMPHISTKISPREADTAWEIDGATIAHSIASKAIHAAKYLVAFFIFMPRLYQGGSSLTFVHELDFARLQFLSCMDYTGDGLNLNRAHRAVDEEQDMSPEHDRRGNGQQTSDTAGWHSLEFVVRQALEIQRDVDTVSAIEFLQKIGVNAQVITRVLAPDAKVRASDQQALDNPVLIAELPITPRRLFARRKPK